MDAFDLSEFKIYESKPCEVNRNQLNRFCCTKHEQSLFKVGFADNFERSKYGDTISPNDIVINQYLSLPYPAVPKHVWSAERAHYTVKKSQVPFLVLFGFALESLNHFLYKGENDFR